MMLLPYVLEALAAFDGPPTVTDLRFRIVEKTNHDAERVREYVFDLIRSGYLKLTPRLRVYR